MQHFDLAGGEGRSNDGTVVNGSGSIIRLQAVSGETLNLSRNSDNISEEVSLWRKKKDLLIKIDGEVQAIIEDFYATEGEGGLDIEGDVFVPYDEISAEAAVAEGENLVWWGDAGTIDMLTAPAEVVNEPVVTESVVAESNPVAPVAQPAAVAQVAEQEDDSDEGGWISDNAWWLAGGALLLIGGAYLLTRDDEEDNSAVLQLSAFAGPFSSEATVNVYDANGKLIGTGTLDSATGQVNVNLGEYRGLAVVEVVDANGTDADYTSEATGAATDLDTSLRAMVEVTDKGTFEVSVTPLTELAAREAGLPDDLSELANNSLTEEQLATNDAIAELFGLEDILAAVTTTLDDDYDSTDAVDAAELYGDILAILSGAEANNGSLDDLIDELMAEITITDGVASLSSAGGALLQQGQAYYEGNGVGAALTGETVVEDMPNASQFPEIISSNELNSDGSLTMLINDVSEGDELTVTLGDQVYSVTLTAEMMSDDTTATIEFPGSQLLLLDDGVQTLLLTVNDIGRQITQISFDRTSPTATISFAEASLIAGETTTVTITFSEEVSGFSLDDLTAESGTLTNLTSEDNITWTATYTPAVDTEDTSVLISLAADGYTDVVSNPGTEASNSVSVDTLAPDAPGLRLMMDSGTSASDLLTKIGLLSKTGVATDSTVEYSIDGGTTWTSSFSAVEGENSVQARQTDGAGNVSEASEVFTFTVDITVAAPTVALKTDSGSSDSDLITNDGTLAITGLEDGATVQYSLDGTNWSDTFEAVEGENSVWVRQTDLAGNLSEASAKLTFTLDTIVPEVSSSDLVKLEGTNNDAGSDSDPQITSVGSDGSYVVTWSGQDSDGDTAIFVQAFDAYGNEVGEANLLEDATLTSGFDSAPQITAIGTEGAYAVAWIGLTTGLEDSSNIRTFVQAFNADGSPNGEQFILYWDENYSANVWSVDITAVGTDGSYVVTWVGPDSDSSAYQTIVQTFNADATVKTDMALLSSNSSQASRVTALGTEGAFVVTWISVEADNSYALYVQHFDTSGQATDSVLTIPMNGYVGDFSISEVGLDGAYVMVWSDEDSDGDTTVYVQLFDSEGNRNVSVVTLEATGNTEGSDIYPQVTPAGTDGAYVVTWSGTDSEGDISIYVQAFNADGSLNGDAVKLEATGVTDRSDINPQITEIGSDGSYVVTWSGVDSDGDTSIYVQVFNADGSLNGDTVKLEGIDVTDGADVTPQITATDEDGSFAVTWSGLDSNGDTSIFVKLFSAGPQLVAAEYEVDLAADAASWEYSTDGGTTWTGGSGTSFTLTEESYDEGLVVVRQYDLAGNMTETSNGSVLDVDLYAPEVTLTAEGDTTTVTEGDSTTLDTQSTEAGSIYFVSTDVTVSSIDDITAASDELWNSVTVSAADTAVDLDTTGLAAGTYVAYAVDEAGNLSAASTTAITVQEAPEPTAVSVLFNFNTGQSSLDADSDREFDADTTYNIYMLVDSMSAALTDMTLSQQWSGAENLGSDDTIILVTLDRYVFGQVIDGAATAVTESDVDQYGAFWGDGLDGENPAYAFAVDAGETGEYDSSVFRMFGTQEDSAQWLVDGEVLNVDDLPNTGADFSDTYLVSITMDFYNQFEYENLS